jgi:hypothetical protein
MAASNRSCTAPWPCACCQVRWRRPQRARAPPALRAGARRGPLTLRARAPPAAGKGRGFVATEAAELGDLLACVRPAAVVHGPVDEQPGAELLMPQLIELRQGALPWAARAALEHLSGGLEGGRAAGGKVIGRGCGEGGAMQRSSARPIPPARAVAPTPTRAGAAERLPPPFWDPPAAGAWSPPEGSSSSAAWPPPVDALARLLKVNAFGDDYEDLAAAAARGAGARSVVGLWPGFSYFNHSCLPSTVHYVVGESMVVRAVQDIEAGAAGGGRGSQAAERGPACSGRPPCPSGGAPAAVPRPRRPGSASLSLQTRAAQARRSRCRTWGARSSPRRRRARRC